MDDVEGKMDMGAFQKFLILNIYEECLMKYIL
jgi:hypothetical protein